MRIKAKRVVMIILLLAGIIWDCLCMLTTMPLAYFTLSMVAIGGYSLIIACGPLLFPLAKLDEKSNQFSELTSQEKLLSGITIALSVAWLITLIACTVYPL